MFMLGLNFLEIEKATYYYVAHSLVYIVYKLDKFQKVFYEKRIWYEPLTD